MSLASNVNFNSEQQRALRFGLYYCSPCAEAFERKQLNLKECGDDTYLNCPKCGHNIDVEYCDDID